MSSHYRSGSLDPRTRCARSAAMLLAHALMDLRRVSSVLTVNQDGEDQAVTVQAEVDGYMLTVNVHPCAEDAVDDSMSNRQVWDATRTVSWSVLIMVDPTTTPEVLSGVMVREYSWSILADTLVAKVPTAEVDQ